MKRKILFIIPSLVGGGAERTLINLLKMIDYNLYEVDLVSILNKGQLISQVPSEVRLSTLFNNEWLVRINSWLQKRFGFTRLIRRRFSNHIQKNYDVGISFMDSNFTDYLFFTERITKRYTWVHSAYKSYNNFWKYYKNPKYKDKLIKERYSKLDGICFVSYDAMDEFVEIFGQFNKMKVIYNIINSNEVRLKAQESIEVNNNKFNFVSLGSLLPVKGYDRLIRAAKIVTSKGYDFTISILGAGREKENLQRMIADLKLQDRVFLKGFHSNPYPYIQQADVFIMTSVSEALPTVLCEALILKKPTLVTNCTGCREVINYGEFGMIAEQDDNDLADKMILMISESNNLIHYSRMSALRSEIFDDQKVLSEYYTVFNL
jgi:glycosyltransferase involved in cell wall biosynthesis